MASRTLVFLILIGFGTAPLNAQDLWFEIDTMMDRLNSEVPGEPGCDYREFSYSGCIFTLSLECSGNDFEIYFDFKDIERVYKDVADIEDNYETLFFVCNNGNNCISSDSDLIPPAPIFPIKLPAYQHSTLGEDSIELFSKLIGNCD